MLRAGCAATTCAPAPRPFTQTSPPLAESLQRHPDSSLITCYSTVPFSNRYPNIKYRPNSLTTNEKTFSNRYFFRPFSAVRASRNRSYSTQTLARAMHPIVFGGRFVERTAVAGERSFLDRRAQVV
jgi:hypothetical protein